jgi:hypothetical protein
MKLKKYISLLISLLVIITLCPSTVFADDIIHDIGSAAELKNALEKVSDGSWDQHTLQMTSDITYPYPITLADFEVTFDLNGHTLTVQPESTAPANVNPQSDNAKLAAVYVSSGSLDLKGEGALNVMAKEGVDYGVACEDGNITVTSITSTGGGTAIFSTDLSKVKVLASASAEGYFACGIECIDSNVLVNEDVTVTGDASCGVYAESYGEIFSDVRVGKNLTVSGEGSQAGMAMGNAWFFVFNNVTVTGNESVGVSAGGEGSWVMIAGNLSSPTEAITAWNGAAVTVGNPEFEMEDAGSVTVTEDNAQAINAVGAMVAILSDVTSSGSGGIGISASAWELSNPARGAFVEVDGKISACNPLLIKSLPVEESEGTQDTEFPEHLKFSDGTNVVYAKSGSLSAHAYDDDYTTDVEPTCTEPGSESIHCSKCDEIKPDSHRVIPAKGHTESDWILDKEATVTEEGARHKECTVCKEVLATEAIPKLPSTDALIDAATGVRAEYEDGSKIESTITLSVTKIPQEESDRLKDNVDKAAKGFILAGLYEIKLMKDGAEVQPDGKIKVTVPLTDEMLKLTDLKVVYIDDNGNVTILPSEIKDGKIIFTAEHFSRYGTIGKVKENNDTSSSPQNDSSAASSSQSENSGSSSQTQTSAPSPQTGDTNIALRFIIAIASLAVIAVLAIKRRRTSRK